CERRLMSGPRALRVMLAGLTLVMLGAALAFGEDAARKAPPDPDPGLLEFLGSVDGLAEVSPDYLAQAERARVARLTVKGRPPRVPSPSAPPATGPTGVKDNERPAAGVATHDLALDPGFPAGDLAGREGVEAVAPAGQIGEFGVAQA